MIKRNTKTFDAIENGRINISHKKNRNSYTVHVLMGNKMINF